MFPQSSKNDPALKEITNIQHRLGIVHRQAAQTIEEMKSFGTLYHVATDENHKLQFSIHAMDRMGLRNIHLSARDLVSINNAVDKALLKGARQSLLVMADRAFIVGVSNRTVITALDSGDMREKVFVNIDSAVII